jgi:hypothetical protein
MVRAGACLDGRRVMGREENEYRRAFAIAVALRRDFWARTENDAGMRRRTVAVTRHLASDIA